MVDPSISFLVENALTAVLLIAYLWYEIHHGRLEKLANQMDAVIMAIIALSQNNPRVDEDAIINNLNGETPQHFVKEPVNVEHEEENDGTD